jgi:hypothetical protein
MRQIVTFNWTTADGYFAAADGNLDWVVPAPEQVKAAVHAIPRFDTILFGRRGGIVGPIPFDQDPFVLVDHLHIDVSEDTIHFQSHRIRLPVSRRPLLFENQKA